MKLELSELRELQSATVERFNERLGNEAAESLKAAIVAAIAVSVDSTNAKGDAKTETDKAWNNWRNVAKQLSDSGASKVEAKYVIAAALPNDDTLTHKSVDTYVSRVVDLVPLFQLSQDKYAALFSKAGIVKGDKPVEPTTDVTHGMAAKLIKTFKNPVPLPEDILADKIKSFGAIIRSMSKIDGKQLEGMSDAEKRKARNEAMTSAHAAIDAVLAQFVDTSAELPDVGADTDSGETAQREAA